MDAARIAEGFSYMCVIVLSLAYSWYSAVELTSHSASSQKHDPILVRKPSVYEPGKHSPAVICRIRHSSSAGSCTSRRIQCTSLISVRDKQDGVSRLHPVLILAIFSPPPACDPAACLALALSTRPRAPDNEPLKYMPFGSCFCGNIRSFQRLTSFLLTPIRYPTTPSELVNL